MSPSPLRRLAYAAGAVPILLAFPLFRLAVRLFAQVGLWRTAGTLGILALAGLVVAAPLALAWPAGRGRGGRTLLVLAGAANLALIGLAIWFISPRLAPGWALGLAGGAWLAFALAFCRQPKADRLPAARAALGAGQAFYLALGLLAPGVAWAAWQDGALVPAGPPPPPAAAARPERPQRIVLITVDALRARSVSAGPNGPTPHLARLATESTWYADARAAADATVPSMPAMLSGVDGVTLQATHVTWEHERLGTAPSNNLREGSYRALPDQLAVAGYRAYYATQLISPGVLGLEHAFTDGYAFGPVAALENGFNVRAFLPLAPIWHELRGRRYQPLDTPGALADHMQRVLAYYRRPDPYAFVWAHLGVPHAPYREVVTGPDGSLRQAAGEPVAFDDVARADAAGLKRIEARYEANVRYMDQELGKLFAALRQDPRWGSTLLLFTADHGEEFRPGHAPHGTGLMSEELTHVPLVIHAPGQAGPARQEALVSGLDVAPTLLAAVFRPPLPALPGQVLGGPAPAGRIVATWGLYRRFRDPAPGQAIAAYQDHFKYVRRYPGGVEALYDLADTPERDVAGRYPARLAALRAYVETHFHPPAR